MVYNDFLRAKQFDEYGPRRKQVRHSMDVREAIASRYSCRAFLAKSVPEDIVRDIIERAARAPSAGNMQPWRVYALAGTRIAALKAELAARSNELPKGEGGDYQIYPEPMVEPYRGRRFTVGEFLYRSIGVPREDKSARYRQYARNYGSLAHRWLCSSRWNGHLVWRNGPISGDICKRSWCWHVGMACIPVHNRPGSLSPRLCVHTCAFPRTS